MTRAPGPPRRAVDCEHLGDGLVEGWDAGTRRSPARGSPPERAMRRLARACSRASANGTSAKLPRRLAKRTQTDGQGTNHSGEAPLEAPLPQRDSGGSRRKAPSRRSIVSVHASTYPRVHGVHPVHRPRNRSASPVSGVAAVGQAPSNSEPIRSGRPPCAGDIDRCWPSTTASVRLARSHVHTGFTERLPVHRPPTAGFVRFNPVGNCARNCTRPLG